MASLRERLARLERAPGRGAAAGAPGRAAAEAGEAGDTAATIATPARGVTPALEAPTRDAPEAGQESASGPAIWPELARLEQRLAGGVAEELTLKQRLERLVRGAARGRGPGFEPDRTRLAGARLEEMVAGCRVENARGEFFLIEDSVPLEHWHGGVPLSRFRALDADSVAILAGDASLAAFELERAVFLDTETTGLAGGTGTAAFLVGVGWVEGERFRIRQYFMRDYHEEPALLRALAGDLAGFAHVVTFNGKMFDLPLLETRFRLSRERYPLGAARHLDLLHPARRLWKARLESCRLQTLEAELLGVRRHGDVPGADIPQLYFDFVRRRDARALVKVFQHNRLDVLSLAAAAILACQWLEEERAEHPLDLISLGRVLERAACHERSEAAYRRAVAGGRGASRLAAQLRLAARLKRRGAHAEAVALWRAAGASGEPWALRELALHLEHRERDPAAALDCVLRALSSGRTLRPGLRRDLERRRARLARRSRRAAD